MRFCIFNNKNGIMRTCEQRKVLHSFDMHFSYASLIIKKNLYMSFREVSNA